MPRLPRVSADRAIRALERLGFEQIRQQGSHVILKKMTAEGPVGCVVPRHKELVVGTLKSILKQARVESEEFIRSL